MFPAPLARAREIAANKGYEGKTEVTRARSLGLGSSRKMGAVGLEFCRGDPRSRLRRPAKQVASLPMHPSEQATKSSDASAHPRSRPAHAATPQTSARSTESAANCAAAISVRSIWL